MTFQDIETFYSNHESTMIVVAAWLTREIKVIYGWIKISVWPRLVSIYPYCKTNGGVFGIIRTFFVGEQKS